MRIPSKPLFKYPLLKEVFFHWLRSVRRIGIGVKNEAIMIYLFFIGYLKHACKIMFTEFRQIYINSGNCCLFFSFFFLDIFSFQINFKFQILDFLLYLENTFFRFVSKLRQKTYFSQLLYSCQYGIFFIKAKKCIII